MGYKETQKKRFKAFLAGDEMELNYLIEEEKAYLFDYLLLMTGDVSRAYDSLDEVKDSIIPHCHKYNNLDQFYVSLYATARNFNRDIWDADIGLLDLNYSEDEVSIESEISGFSSIVPNIDSDKKDDLEEQAVDIGLDRVLHNLSGPVREVLVLKYRQLFDISSMATIMGLSSERVDSYLNDGISTIRESLGADYEVSEKIKELPHYSIPDSCEPTTLALSQVIRNVKKGRKSFWQLAWHISLIFIFATIIVAASYLAFYFLV